MARHKTPYDESLTREIYDAYRQYALCIDSLPNPHAFYHSILVGQLRYALSYGGFKYHWTQLQLMGKIRVDPLTNAVSASELDLKEHSPQN